MLQHVISTIEEVEASDTSFFIMTSKEMESECSKKNDSDMHACAINALGEGRQDEIINDISVNRMQYEFIS